MTANPTWHTRAFSSFLTTLRNFSPPAALPTDAQNDSPQFFASQIDRALDDHGIDPARFWSHIVASTALHAALPDAVHEVLRVHRSNVLEEKVCAWLELIRIGARTRENHRVGELRARQGPIRLQWEARGPGLIQAFETATSLTLPSVWHVVLVEPSERGGVRPILDFHAVEFEALLTDIHQGLPEVLRLAWGLCQLGRRTATLGCEDEMNGIDEIKGELRDPRENLSLLAILPPLLRSAEHVEWATFSVESMELAMRAWRIPRQGFPEEWTDRRVAERLYAWWVESQDRGTPWLQSLSRLL